MGSSSSSSSSLAVVLALLARFRQRGWGRLSSLSLAVLLVHPMSSSLVCCGLVLQLCPGGSAGD